MLSRLVLSSAVRNGLRTTLFRPPTSIARAPTFKRFFSSVPGNSNHASGGPSRLSRFAWGTAKYIALPSAVMLGTASFVMDLPPSHVLEQGFRSSFAVYTVAAIGLDYKWSLRNEPEDIMLDKAIFEDTSPDQNLTEEEREALEREREKWRNERRKIHQRCAERLLKLCQINGGIFTKAGQHIASLSHALPAAYTTTLQVLQDHAPTVPFSEIEKLFLRELHALPKDLFATFDSTPIAAASLAQVYKATTKEGELVAVKVQYPHLQRSIRGDLKTIEALTKTIAYFFPKFEFSWIVPEFEDNLNKELDFVQEKNNAQKSAHNFRNNPQVAVPRIVEGLSTKKILTMEFMEGVKITDIKSLESMNLNPKEVAQLLVEVFSDQIFKYGFIHCDPHPGNILIRPMKDNKTQPQLVLLDHGLYRELTEEARMSQCRLWRGLVLRDRAAVAEEAKSLGASSFPDLLALMLTFRPLSSRQINSKNSLTKQELREIKKLIEDMQDNFPTFMKGLSRDLLLIMKTINLIRSINRELGSQVNRFEVMGRHSIHGLYFHNPDLPPLGMGEWLMNWLRKQKDLLQFEFHMALVKFLLGSQTPPEAEHHMQTKTRG